MFDIGFSEMVVLGIIALVVIGPKQLPEVARMAARFVNDVKRITGEFTGQFMAVKEQANKFVTEAQDQVTKEINEVAGTMKKYVEEPVIPPPLDGPLPEPDPPANLPDHAPYDPRADGEQEQMTLDLDATDKKNRESGGN